MAISRTMHACTREYDQRFTTAVAARILVTRHLAGNTIPIMAASWTDQYEFEDADSLPRSLPYLDLAPLQLAKIVTDHRHFSFFITRPELPATDPTQKGFKTRCQLQECESFYMGAHATAQASY